MGGAFPRPLTSGYRGGERRRARDTPLRYARRLFLRIAGGTAFTDRLVKRGERSDDE